jgi:hypothetical protein
MANKILADLMTAYMVLDCATAVHRAEMDTTANDAAMENLAKEFMTRLASAIRLGGEKADFCEFYCDKVQKRIERVVQAIDAALNE